MLVFPIKNAKEPKSLWSEFYPRSKMLWEWDDNGDGRVADMWYLMKKLSDCREVVYSKWYQGRATFFSRELFTAMLRLMRPAQALPLSPIARQLLDVLEGNSPLSTKDLKRETDLIGRLNEPQYARAMKELFRRLLIVGFGEVDDGAFPSLAVGATSSIYEDLWSEADQLSREQAEDKIEKAMPPGTAFRKYFDKNRIIERGYSSSPSA